MTSGRLLGLVSVLSSSVAFADASLPQKGASGGGSSGWLGRCAERFEQAKLSLLREVRIGRHVLRTSPLFKDASVEVRAEEASEPGDPSARATVDVIEYRVAFPDGRLYVARVEVSREAVRGGDWSRELHRPETRTLAHERYRNGLKGTVVFPGYGLEHGGTPGRDGSFHTFFRRAIDDCLTIGRLP